MNDYPGDTMGSGKDYSHKLNINSFINDFWIPRYAFTPEQSAVIVGTKQIPDCSFYQGVINWDLMRQKTDAVIIRAGQNIWVDPQFARNYSEAKKRGMLRGVYYFYDDRKSPKEQADLLISLIKDDLPEMEVWADWEKSYGGAYGGIGNVVAFMQYIEQALPSVNIGIYTGYYWFKDHSNAVTNASQYTYLKTKPLWLAWYSNNAAAVLVPLPWTSLLLWQFGTPSVGASYGVQTVELDMNIPNMSDTDFYVRYRPVSEPVTGGKVKYNVTNNSLTSTRTIRKGPGVVFASVDNLPAGGGPVGDFLYTYDVANTTLPALAGDKWIQIGANRWLAWIHKGVPYLNVTTEPDAGLDINSLSVHTSLNLTFADSNGNVIGTKGAETVELV